MEHKFKDGEVVLASAEPTIRLIVRRYVDMIYYCKVESDPNGRERVYFERELMSVPVA
ncbi:MAG TPA: hypothetical protein VL651_13350 [Bacteroidia bacterium]|nr:hypothetical protein [Bacteroidia bacterium]